jgi:hypothetical protein
LDIEQAKREERERIARKLADDDRCNQNWDYCSDGGDCSECWLIFITPTEPEGAES